MDYYSPQKIQANIQFEQQDDHAYQSQGLRQDEHNHSDDFSKAHWNAIRTFDIDQTIGKHPIHTFKKVYAVGVQLGFIYDDITLKILRYGPHTEIC